MIKGGEMDFRDSHGNMVGKMKRICYNSGVEYFAIVFDFMILVVVCGKGLEDVGCLFIRHKWNDAVTW